MTLSERELERYSRQLVVPAWSGAAQRALGEAVVVIIGVGALGTPVASYLAGAGAGRLVLVDSDVVDLSNLHRQTIHTTSDLGAPKVDVAARTLRALNPEVAVEPVRERLDETSAARLLGGASIVVDCSDSFETRYAVNDACCVEGTALVEAGVLGLEGLVLSVRPGESACYRCAFPTAPAAGDAPSCREAGVLGPMAGIVGSHQALEAMKLLTGVGEPLLDRLLHIDGRDATQTLVAVRRRPGCPGCAGARGRAGSPAMPSTVLA